MFVFRKKLWLDNFVLRLTDLYLSYSVTTLGKNDFKNSILDGNPKFGTILLTEDRLSFCVNLDVINLEVEIQCLFLGRSYGSIILF